jgi:SAM-dependent methyltransferase
MRESIRQFVNICAETLPITEPIYEFGALQVPDQVGFADLRPFFPGKEFYGADIRSGPGVDFILDLHKIDLPSESVGTVLCLETLEHVEFPWRAVAEMHRILRSDGILIMSSVMNYPIHNNPSDYWRFTPEGFKSLLQPFAVAYVNYAGMSHFPRTVLGIGLKEAAPEATLDLLEEKLQEWKKLHSKEEFPGWLKRSKELFVPPILRLLWRNLRSTFSQKC